MHDCYLCACIGNSYELITAISTNKTNPPTPFTNTCNLIMYTEADIFIVVNP